MRHKVEVLLAFLLIGLLSSLQAKVFVIGDDRAELNKFDVKQYHLNANAIYKKGW